MLFLFSHGLVFKILALAVFALAAISDYLDGLLARRLNAISNFGIIMDPIADKILVLAAFISFIEMKVIPAWMVIVVIMRELLITSLRIFSLGRGLVLKAERCGKHKTMSQMVTIFIILLFLIFKELAFRFGFWTDTVQAWSAFIILTLMSITVVLTATSGISYLWQNRHLIMK
jgi:CDP-diacylglycerol--glycerol-3-phosphate 3-phosphatidyltransferase